MGGSFAFRRFCWLGGGQVFEARDVQDGALSRPLGQVVGVHVDADVHGAANDPGHVVVVDVVGLAIGKANAKWLERLCVHALFEFDCCDHNLQIGQSVVGLYPK